MLPRRKNLLEAFKRSDSAPAGAPAPAASTPSPTPGPLFQRPVSTSAGARGQPALALVAIGLVVAFALGFVLGRSTGGGAAQAHEPEQKAPAPSAARTPPAAQPRAFQERPAAPAEDPKQAGAAPGSQRLEDSALYDPKNLQTVVVASYSKSEQNTDLAWATYEHLRQANLPVFPPVASRNLLVVLAGAAPTAAELKQTEAAVKALSRDGKKKDYTDAYTARIDTLIARSTKKQP